MIVNLTGVKWNFSVILICISFMAKEAEHFFMYLLAICTSSENCLFNLLTHLLIGFFLLAFNFLSSLYIFDINPLSEE
jgi:hypothetical protein